MPHFNAVARVITGNVSGGNDVGSFCEPKAIDFWPDWSSKVTEFCTNRQSKAHNETDITNEMVGYETCLVYLFRLSGISAM